MASERPEGLPYEKDTVRPLTMGQRYAVHAKDGTKVAELYFVDTSEEGISLDIDPAPGRPIVTIPFNAYRQPGNVEDPAVVDLSDAVLAHGATDTKRVEAKNVRNIRTRQIGGFLALDMSPSGSEPF